MGWRGERGERRGGNGEARGGVEEGVGKTAGNAKGKRGGVKGLQVSDTRALLKHPANRDCIGFNSFTADCF